MNVRAAIAPKLVSTALAAVLLALSAGVASARLLRVPTGVHDSCDPVAPASIVENEAFTPSGARLSNFPDEPIVLTVATAFRPRYAPERIGGLPISWQAANHWYSEVVYFDGPIDPALTRPELIVAGGLILRSNRWDPGLGPVVSGLKHELGDRVVEVKIGPYDGGLVWADPMSNGVRPHQLSWSDGRMAHRLIGVRTAEAIVDLARAAVC